MKCAAHSPTSFHADTFKGLKFLQKLRLLNSNSNIFASGALHAFNTSNTLKVLDFNFGKMIGEISGDQLCTISSSLQMVNLSRNSFYGFPLDLPCILHDLSVLILKNQTYEINNWNFKPMCQAAPNLNELYASNVDFITTATCTVDRCRCLSLTILDLSRNQFTYDDKDAVYTPRLEKLYLSSLFLVNRNLLTIVKIFKSHLLKHLSLNGNQISVIDQQDAAFLYNLTYLDLSSNHLTSTDILQYFRNIQILSLDNNQIGTVPKSILSKSTLSYLKKLNLNQNPLVCDCNVEPLAKWLQTEWFTFRNMLKMTTTIAVYYLT